MTDQTSQSEAAAIEALLQSKLTELLRDADLSRSQEFWGRQFDLGLARVASPVGLGGLGLDGAWQNRVESALRAAGAPSNKVINPIGLGFVTQTLLAHGTEQQRRTHLRPIFTTEQIWCQLFSEPGAGSDLAGLSTRAIREGDAWLINGQKVWTSLAHLAHRAILLARTDPEAPKHKGLTFFVVDMSAPGVAVRPLRQMTGEAEFNEVYLTDLRLPDAARVGPPGSGWKVAITTLANERQVWANSDVPRETGFIAAAVREWRARGYTDAARRDDLLRLWVRAEVARLHSIRLAQLAADGGPGPENSVIKVAMAELNQDISSFSTGLLGREGLLYSGYDLLPGGAGSPGEDHFHTDDITRSFLRARANSIEAGTSEINRNILAERVLGLPGDTTIDRNTPWNQLKRNRT